MSSSPRSSVRALRQAMSGYVVGQDRMIESLLIGLLADGHLLIEGLPGLAKTRAIKGLAKHLDASLSRVQFTPDLLPSDVTGTEVYHQVEGGSEFKFDPGPIFANLVLADEINRAPAKVQAALLEAMEERQVTVAGTTHALPPLFLVMATQNPIEQEGTYPLPEAQMDRFLMKVVIDYPSAEAEREVIAMVRDECRQTGAVAGHGGPPEQITQDAVFAARSEIDDVHVAASIDEYIVALIEATRYPERYGDDLRRLIQVGASPRGSLALDKCSRAHAWLEGRDHVIPDDVRAIATDCLRHRMILSYDAEAEGVTPAHVIGMIVEKVAVA